MKQLLSLRKPIIPLATVFVLLGLLYSFSTPIFEAPDESYHYFFVQHLLEGDGLPVQGAPGEALYRQEGSQPPLYYLAGSLLVSWIDTADARTYIRENPQANQGDPGNPGNKNVYVHTGREAFPFHTTPLAVHVLRLFSIALGLVVVLMTYATARIVFPDRQLLALFAAALAAFTPQFLFVSAAVNNDNAINALSAVGVYVLARMWRGDRTRRASVGLGMVIGLAALAKLGGLILLAYALGVIAYLAVTRREYRWGVYSAIIVLALTAVLSGWWYVRNLQLYGDFTGLSAMYPLVGQRALNLSELIAELPGLWYSTWGVFGWFSIMLPDGVYAVYALITVGGLIGGAAAIIRAARKAARPSTRTAPRSLHLSWGRCGASFEPIVGLIVWMVVVTIGVLRWTASTHGSQGRLLFPAMPAFAILIGAGLWSLLGRWRRAGLPAIGAGLLALAVWVPFEVIQPAYAFPARIALSDVPPDVTRLNVDFDHTIRLVGGTVETRTARPGDEVTVVLYWQALTKPSRAYMVYVHLLGRNLELVGNEDAYHGDGTYPSDLWQPGEVLADRYVIRLSSAALTPTRMRVEVGLRDQGQPVRAVSGDGQPWAGLLVVDEFRLESASVAPAPQTGLQYRLGNAIDLTGYDGPQADSSKRVITYRLHWHVLDAMPEDYTVFAHLVDADGNTVGQGDGPPFNGDYPTSWWQSGEQFVEDRSVPWPIKPGDYHLAIGLYRLADDTRLSITDAAGQALPDSQIILEPALRIPN